MKQETRTGLLKDAALLAEKTKHIFLASVNGDGFTAHSSFKGAFP
jgi:hypothetical protein